jgi:bifunctional non-homologous end joining protein LigD
MRARTRKPLPAYAPQLATLVKAPPDGDGWLHEPKLDGFRMGLAIDADRVRLLTRNGNDWTARFPEIVEAVKTLRMRAALIDGELAVLLPDGRTSFQALQGAGGGRLVFFAFDLLARDGESLAAVPLEQRKRALRALIPARHRHLRYVEHVVGNGPRAFADACRAGLEGIVSKRREGLIRSGRSPEWTKTKCVQRQELVIGGFTEPRGARTGIGALLVGHYAGDRLVWAGKVGTGFAGATALALRARLDALEQPGCPFTPPVPGKLGREAHWVRPDLVAEVAFTEWTAAGKIRHPSFQGLREDKPARQVRREIAAAAPPPTPAKRRAAPARTAARPSTRSRAAASASATPTVAGVAITSADRIVYPDDGITKLDLARYVETVAEAMLPHVTGRPLTLLFCPEGLAGGCQFLKHGKAWGPKALRRVKIREKTKTGEYMVAEDVAGLVSLMQMNWIEAHTWNSTIDHLETPDRIVLDVDPGPEVRWPDVVRAAQHLRDVLATLSLHSWVKTTGGRGLHVVVPIVPEHGWAECLAFAERLAFALARDDPRRYTTEFAKAGRERKLLIDYLRNNRTNTSVAAFSPRARPGATVSTPLSWDELSTRTPPTRFTVKTVPGRLARQTQDPWAGYFRSRQRLTQRAIDALRDVSTR